MTIPLSQMIQESRADFAHHRQAKQRSIVIDASTAWTSLSAAVTARAIRPEAPEPMPRHDI